ncbi:thioredoxin-like protein [Tirmania nivea]|nr:thioredoxin-like protein [Tirmania nivea]
MPASDAAKAKVQKIIEENPVVIFSKSYCRYCRAAKTLLTEYNAKFFAIELDQVDDGSDIQKALQDLTGQNTVPNIFINKRHIGGNSDLQSKKAQLKEMLIEAGAV